MNRHTDLKKGLYLGELVLAQKFATWLTVELIWELWNLLRHSNLIEMGHNMVIRIV